MTKFDLSSYIEEYTDGQVKVEYAEKPKNDFDEPVFYEYKREGTELTIIVDEKTFEPSDKKVAEALVDNVSFNIKEREKAESLLSDFVNREGKYLKIKEKEEKENEKERLRIQKSKEKERKEEMKNILKELEGEKLEKLWKYAKQLTEVSDEAAQKDEEQVLITVEA